MSSRYVRTDRRIDRDSDCLLCGCRWGIGPGEPRVCKPVVCMACGSRQCLVNGLARGQCGICGVGILTGWSRSDRRCQYRGCPEPAIVRMDGAHPDRCRVHAERGKWAGYISARLAEREQGWAEVPDDGPFPLR